MPAELRSALAQAKRHPWFFAGAALSLAIGMSLATAVFSVVDAALLRPLPFHAPDRLVHISETVPYIDGKRGDMSRIPSKHVLAVQQEARSLSEVASWANANARLGVAGESRSVNAAAVTINFFRLLGVRPQLGRDFDETDGVADSRVVLIAHALWTAQFGADRSLVGRDILLNGKSHRVIGVMPEGFGFPPVRLWLPLPIDAVKADANSARDNDWPPYYTFARLAPGASIGTLSAELAVIYKRLYGDHELRKVRSSRAVPLGEYLASHLREQLQLWVAIAILVGILCAVNFATVSLARGMRRRSEIAVRCAMGASMLRVVRLLVVESVLIALAGGAAAIVLGAWLLKFVEMWFANGPIAIEPTISWPTILFGLVGTTLVGILFATAPAMELARVDLRSRLQGEQTTSRRGELRGRRALVGLQLCLALTAIAAVAALAKAERRHWAFGVGFDHRPILIASLAADTSAQLLAAPLLDRMRGIPGVTSAAVVGRTRSTTAWTDNDALTPFRAAITDVTPGYFTTLGVRVLAGRLPSDDEVVQRAPVGVIPTSMAHYAFGSDSGAVGKRMHFKARGKPGAWMTVIGVVPDLGGRALYQLSSTIYTMHDLPLSYGTVVARTQGEPQYRIKEVSQIGTTYDSRLTISDVRTAQALVESERGALRGRTLFILSIAGLAVILAIVGMYGLTSYNTEARAKEFGIRIALGASPSKLAYALVGELWLVALISVGIAWLASGRLTVFLDDMLRNPMMEHPLIVFPVVPALAAAAGLCFVMLVGTAVPLRRVLRMDVMRAMQAGTME